MGLKMTETIFLDTAFFKALVDIDDDFHSQAEKMWQRVKQEGTSLITTNFILDETFTLLRVRCGYFAALDLRERLAAGLKRMKIIRITVNDEMEAWNWFTNLWKDLSFTDCTSFAVMKRLGLTRVATYDDHFQKAGFKIEK